MRLTGAESMRPPSFQSQLDFRLAAGGTALRTASSGKFTSSFHLSQNERMRIISHWLRVADSAPERQVSICLDVFRLSSFLRHPTLPAGRQRSPTDLYYEPVADSEWDATGMEWWLISPRRSILVVSCDSTFHSMQIQS
jgi:hypothetical protein